MASATALRRAIESQTGLKPEIKWPNDILVHGRKVAGILTELSAELDHVKYVVLGIGVDVNLNPGDFPAELRKVATSLKAELGKPVSRPDLAVAILRELDHDYARIAAGQFAALADEWEEHGTTIGHDVVIRIGRPPDPRPGRIAGRGWRAAAAHRTRPPGADHWGGCDAGEMILLFDIGNTNTHLGLANSRRVVKQADVPTAAWFNGTARKLVAKFAGRARLEGAALCSVVPRATPFVRQSVTAPLAFALPGAYAQDPARRRH